jgi:hypothetical protein
MSMLAAQIDRFVRWFFNVSPTTTSIEPRLQPEPTDTLERHPLLRNGVMGSAVVIALILLAVFYSVVAGAVDRAAQRRTDARLEASALALRTSHRPVLAVPVQAARPSIYVPRTVAYVRSVN